MALSLGFSDSVLELFAFLPRVEVKRMFGGAGVYSSGLIFGLLDDDVLWFKVDEISLPLFEAEGMEAFTFRAKDGSEMTMAYRRAPDAVWDDPDAARRWAQVAIDAALRKKQPKPKAKAAPKAKAEKLLISGPWDED